MIPMSANTNSANAAVANIVEQIIPIWLVDPSAPDPDPRFPKTKLERDLREHNLTCLFERILDGMCEGNSASAVIQLDHNKFKVGEVMKWILTNPERKRRYDEADGIRGIVRVDRARQLVDDETADPAYKKEVVEFTKWEASKVNREKYGDKVTVESTRTTVDIKMLIEQRTQRLQNLASSPHPPSPPLPQGTTYDAE